MYNKTSSGKGKLKSPPREVPFPVILSLIFSDSNFSVCWVLAFIALVISFFIFGKNLREQRNFRGNIATTQARITSTNSMDFEVSNRGSSTLYRKAFATTFSFRLGKKAYHGQSYSSTGFEGQKTAKVEYLKSNPDISRIVGTRANDLDPFVMFIVLAVNIALLGYSIFGAIMGLITAYHLKNSDIETGMYKIILKDRNKTLKIPLCIMADDNGNIESIPLSSTLKYLIAPCMTLIFLGVCVYYFFL